MDYPSRTKRSTNTHLPEIIRPARTTLPVIEKAMLVVEAPATTIITTTAILPTYLPKIPTMVEGNLTDPAQNELWPGKHGVVAVRQKLIELPLENGACHPRRPIIPVDRKESGLIMAAMQGIVATIITNTTMATMLVATKMEKLSKSSY